MGKKNNKKKKNNKSKGTKQDGQDSDTGDFNMTLDYTQDFKNSGTCKLLLLIDPELTKKRSILWEYAH